MAISAYDDWQKAAIAATRNTVVAAGAGSGKTAVLAGRFVRLVAEEGYSSDSILCLTFTRKAAAEMFFRIHASLSGLARANPSLEGELARLDSSNVSTLDSFCSRVARNACQARGVGPDFVQDDDATREMAERLALRFLLERTRDPTVSLLARAFRYDALRDSVLVDLACRRFFLADEFDPGSLVARLESTLDAEIESGRAFLASASSRAESLPDKWKATESWRTALASIPRAGDIAGFSSWLDGVTSASALGLGAIKSDEVAWLAKGYREIRERAERASGACALRLGLGTQRRFLDLVAEFREIFLEEKRATGILSFADVVRLALDALKRDFALRDFYKRRYRAVMIDEFQDDDALQRDLLYLLAERDPASSTATPGPGDLARDKLFFVGDEKQSIYRFRGADVSVFRSLAAELTPDSSDGATGSASIAMGSASIATGSASIATGSASIATGSASIATGSASIATGSASIATGSASIATGSAALELPVNYRSEPQLVDFYNGLFSRIMPDVGADYEARFSPLRRRDATPGADAGVDFIRARAVDEGDGQDDAEREARAVAAYIVDAVGAGMKVARRPKDGPPFAEPCSWDDFAILFRTTAPQAAFERRLRLSGVPFVAQDPSGLFADAPFNDLYSVLRLAAYPQDSLAYASVLRGPFVNLSDDSLIEILADPGFGPFERPCETLGDAVDRAKYARGGALYREIRERADRDPVASILSRLWYAEGYRCFVLDRPGKASFLDHFDFTHALAAKSDASGEGLSGFVDRYEAMAGGYERVPDLNVARLGSGGVKLMTVHKSKGLEFPVAILPRANSRADRSRREKCWAWRDDLGPVMDSFDPGGRKRGNWLYDSMREDEKKRDEAELKRLFYVACTRAETRLVVSFSYKDPPKGDAPERKASSFLDLLRAAFGGEDGGEWPGRLIDSTGDAGESPRAVIAASDRVSSSERAMSIVREAYGAAPRSGFARARDGVAVTELAGDATASFDRSAAPASADPPPKGLSESDFGTLVHACLFFRLSSGGRRIIAGKALERALEKAENKGMARSEAERLADSFFSHPLGKKVAGLPPDRVSSEVEFLAVARDDSGARFETGAMDLLIDRGDSAWVVDFKTDRAVDPGRHAAQLAEYDRAAAAIRAKPSRRFVFFLRASRAFEYTPGGAVPVDDEECFA